MKWVKGRQGSGYDKLKIISCNTLFHFDIYLIRFINGSYIPAHKDPVKYGEHYRINIILKKPDLGGHFFCNNVIYKNSRLIIFRPDIEEHSVTRVEGSRYVLSIGFILKKKNKRD